MESKVKANKPALYRHYAHIKINDFQEGYVRTRRFWQVLVLVYRRDDPCDRNNLYVEHRKIAAMCLGSSGGRSMQVAVFELQLFELHISPVYIYNVLSHAIPCEELE